MSRELFLLVGEKIKEQRVQKKITLDKLAGKAGVTKGLISQIENNRTIPSLPVLFALIDSLELNVKEFFTGLHEAHSIPRVLIIREDAHAPFKKEPVTGFQYNRILSRSLMTQTVDVVLLELKPGAGRKKMIRTDAFECKYIIEGKLEYQVGEHVFQLNAGDTLFFDGREPHKLKNTGRSKVRILVMYFF
ncbi:helix-turn-helix domain-containing protein [Niabella drilacis]|uniref:Transcriptional regulator, XRE family with cupin sensor n=1 Tax=Niabella drilacis (strain DSM 25811 / CCM 8410 / CCUG 62505 / LMG 26954 / E90) TaxID=1285928 RepID=A0A1G6R8Q0_NIADE|nr:XRE family transcriptional regulator [Niabella drilacis]SDD00999.1 transcriptional regulator, XRE family with cupin sensor [Niabella drilacis]